MVASHPGSRTLGGLRRWGHVGFIAMLIALFFARGKWTSVNGRRGVAAAGLSALLAVGIAHLIATLWDRPRPYEAHPDVNSLDHSFAGPVLSERPRDGSVCPGGRRVLLPPPCGLADAGRWRPQSPSPGWRPDRTTRATCWAARCWARSPRSSWSLPADAAPRGCDRRLRGDHDRTTGACPSGVRGRRRPLPDRTARRQGCCSTTDRRTSF